MSVFASQGKNSQQVADLYGRYLNAPGSVSGQWRDFFKALSKDEKAAFLELSSVKPRAAAPSKAPAKGGTPMDEEALRQATRDSIAALMMIRVYRVRGHLEADLDPLGLREHPEHPELSPAHYGFTEADYDRKIFINGVLGLEYATLREIMDIVRDTYCGKIGVEFMHMSDPDQKAWIQRRIEEPHNKTQFTDKGKIAILERLTATECFEQFLHKKHPGTKRFGIDGGEALIPAMEQIMKRGGQLGLKEIVLGMPHRGRLNVLTNVMGKPFQAVFSEFMGNSSHPEDMLGSGDVKYHLGTSSDREFDGNSVHLSLTANPSHLEAVNPVVIGKVRAKQAQHKDEARSAVMPILMHGDAAYAGQGIVAETLMISELPGYRVGGTIHVVVNNQIGFTTTPKFGRSGPYATDVSKMLSSPIFHVNGDDPEAVVHVARIATEFRQEFDKDVVIDMFCYRRYGHNEGDEPAFTQPLMYKRIAEHKSTRALYAQQLREEGILAEGEEQKIMDDFYAHLEEELKAANDYKSEADMLEGAWDGLDVAREDGARKGQTAIDKKTMKKVASVLTEQPDDFNLNKKLVRFIDARKKMFDTGEGFDWATAEALAFGSTLLDGSMVRLSGQDCRRGTFSQRHAVYYDQVNEHRHIPLTHLEDDQPTFEVHNSPLSEMAVMGFDYGFTLAEPNALVMWEGQFGDFANGAQVIIDQFISSSESKWLRMSGLVLLLPHGYEGQGPEHSSARLERYLQLSAEDNWQVVNCTTPANYFHALRRQTKRNFRKPLIVMTPKSLLRHKLCVSSAENFLTGSSFHRVLWETKEDMVTDKKVKRVVICSGKVFYDLWQMREDQKIKDVAILRMEQLYPFPTEALTEELKKYPNAKSVVWCQEEPANMGAWTYVDRKIEKVLEDMKHKHAHRPDYAGRAESASTATGSLAVHNRQQEALCKEALGIK